MMKPHIELLPKNILKLKTKPTLRLVSYGICFAVIFCFGIFAYQMIGNNEEAKAGRKKKFKISLFNNKQNREIAPAQIELSQDSDSLYFEFMTVDKNEIRSAVLNISSHENNQEKIIQAAKTFTVGGSGSAVNRISVPLKILPEKIFIQAKVSLKTSSIEEAKEANSQFMFDKKSSTVSIYR